MTRCLRLLTTVVLAAVALMAWGQVPARPDPPRLVNDLAGILGDTSALEDSLRAFDRRTGNQIVVVTLNDLGGMDRAMMAYEIGQQWGVGRAKNNNGVVILVKPKTANSRGEAFIATGYGLEGAIPDALCSQIVNREMIPSFKKDDYSNGVWAAVRVVKGLAQGEFSQQDYLGEAPPEDDLSLTDIFFLILVIVLIIYAARYLEDKMGGGGGGGGYSGTWGGFYMGGGSFGGGSSSWGGFGGGSFGGGGGGGSW